MREPLEIDRSELLDASLQTPTSQQFLILAQKVEELEDRIRSLAVNDLGRVRERIEEHEQSIQNMKSARFWIRGFSRKLRRVRRRFFKSGS